MKTTCQNTLTYGLVCLLVLCLAGMIMAMPPDPEMLEKIAAGKMVAPFPVSHLDDLHKRGICTADSFFFRNPNGRPGPGMSAAATGPFKILGILVKFSDKPSSVAATFFDSLVFDSIGNTVRNYFKEISYVQLNLITVNLPSSLGWQTAPQTYAYYVNGAYGLGTYPNNSQKLVENLVDQVAGSVDFSNYDNNHDGYVDVLLVIHAGTGAEKSGNLNDMWSHKWAITPRLKNGVYISSYTVQPEYWTTPGDMTIGVYSHELCHGFGLPDLYDTDNSSKGIGRWCIMAYGSWNGTNGASPSHPCAWSRIKMGFATSTNVTGTLTNQAIANVEQGGPIYRLWTSGLASQEYYLVENRQKLLNDAGLPASGLLIWHIDDAKSSLQNPNNQEWYPGQTAANHFEVAIEEADGLYELEHNIDAGDGADPFPGTSNVTTFSDGSTPSANSYSGAPTNVQVTNISASASTMHADLIVSIAAGVNDGDNSLPHDANLAQNYPNPFNPTTTIGFDLPSAGEVKLEVFNVLGERVRTLFNGRLQAGSTSIVWDGRNDAGQSVGSGAYFYRLNSGNKTLVKKMVLVK